MEETIPNFLKRRAFLTPERPALDFAGEALTFKELYDRSFLTAGRLSTAGLKGGGYVAVLLKNSLDTAVILFSLQLGGIPAVLLNNRLSASELAWQIQDSGAAFLITEAFFSGTVDAIKNFYGEFKTILKENLTAIKPMDFSLADEVGMNQVCTVMYTSGTTGNPKGVLQTYGNHWWSATGSALNIGISDKDCWLCAVPIFHISGYSILMRSVIYGMPVVLHETFDETRVIQDISEKGITIMSVVGTMLTRIVNKLEDGELPEQFRCMMLGGGPAPLPLLEECIKKGIPVLQTYGMTETASQTATLSPEYSLEKIGSAGKPLFPVHLKIILPNGMEAGWGQAGEILVKGPNVTSGYLNRKEETLAKIEDGWLHTGDIGYLDEAGFLYVLDRRADLIISGGENIYPAELENVLLAYPGIVEAGVTGIPNEEWGHIPVAFVVANRRIDEDSLQSFCRNRLANYKIPRKVYFVNELPRNASNKLLRRKLLDLLIGERSPE